MLDDEVLPLHQNTLCLADAHLRRMFAQEFVGRRQADAFERGADGVIAIFF